MANTAAGIAGGNGVMPGGINQDNNNNKNEILFSFPLCFFLLN